ncbi:MAG: sensor histidine kinase [Sulfitobacter sp.]
MTLRHVLSNTFGWTILVLMVLSFEPIRSAQAQEMSVSRLPITDLLTHLDNPQNTVGLSGGRARYDFTLINDGPEDVFWYFRTEVLSPLSFVFYVNNKTEPVFQSSFRSREQKSHASQGPVLRSDLIVMSPGERLAVQAVFEEPPGRGLFPISLLSKDAYDTLKQRRSMSHGMFFGTMMAFVVLFLLSPNFLLNAASNWFGAYLLAIALLNMHSHGYTYDYFDISTEAYFPLTRLLHTCVMLFYLLFVVSFLKAADAYPIYWKSVWTFIILGITIALFEQLLQSANFQIIANLVPLTFLGFGLWGAYLALRDRLHGSLFFMTGFAVLLFGGGVNFMASLPRFASWNEGIDQFTLLLQTTDALIFGGAILNQIYGLRQARDQAIDAQLDETQRRLDLSTQLLSTEGDLRKTRELAERHRASLASTSHDLRQPIASLRMSLEVAKDHSPELVSELSAGIQFLDRLLEQTLAKTRRDSGMDAPPERPDQHEAVELQVILQNAQRMFALEAAQKGITLNVVESSLVVRIPTIDLIRIVSNLTSNAVRCTTSGVVLIGVRTRNGLAAIEVWDTGHGIPPEQLGEIMQPYFRGAPTAQHDGTGLGLSIVKQLADQNGLTLKVRSELGKGSVFVLGGLAIVQEGASVMTSK